MGDADKRLNGASMMSRKFVMLRKSWCPSAVGTWSDMETSHVEECCGRKVENRIRGRHVDLE